MKFTHISLLSILLIACSTISTYTYDIKAIFIDIEALFETNDMKASKHVGKINSIKYLTKVGHVPSQADLFKQLKAVPATSTEVVFNQNLEMPLIFSDWLLGVQPVATLQTAITKYLASAKTSAVTGKNITDIEKTILENIVDMMFTPSKLAGTQQTTSQMPKIIDQLKAQGYKVYLAGNCADILAFKKEFDKVFAKLDGFYSSGKLHLLKPYQAFYKEVLLQTHVSAAQALWIETEDRFVKNATKFGYNVVQFNPDKPKNIHQELQKFGIKVK